MQFKLDKCPNHPKYHLVHHRKANIDNCAWVLFGNDLDDMMQLILVAFAGLPPQQHRHRHKMRLPQRDLTLVLLLELRLNCRFIRLAVGADVLVLQHGFRVEQPLNRAIDIYALSLKKIHLRALTIDKLWKQIQRHEKQLLDAFDLRDVTYELFEFLKEVNVDKWLML